MIWQVVFSLDYFPSNQLNLSRLATSSIRQLKSIIHETSHPHRQIIRDQYRVRPPVEAYIDHTFRSESTTNIGPKRVKDRIQHAPHPQNRQRLRPAAWFDKVRVTPQALSG